MGYTAEGSLSDKIWQDGVCVVKSAVQEQCAAKEYQYKSIVVLCVYMFIALDNLTSDCSAIQDRYRVFNLKVDLF